MSYNIWLMLVCISFYSPHGSSRNVPEYSFGRISWNLPWHTLAIRFILLLDNLQIKFEWGRDDVNGLCLHINQCPLTLAQMYICPLGKNPIFPQFFVSSSEDSNLKMIFVQAGQSVLRSTVAEARVQELPHRPLRLQDWDLVYPSTSSQGQEFQNRPSLMFRVRV